MSLMKSVPATCWAFLLAGSPEKKMHHSFDIDEALTYGILEAVLLNNIKFWIAKNKGNTKHFYDGCYWTYNSAKAFCSLFPYASQQQIQRALKRLEDLGAIRTGNFNPNPYDRTKWYSIVDIDSSNLINGKTEIDHSYKTDVKPDISVVPIKPDNFEAFWKAYPRKTNKGFARTVFAKINPDRELFAKIMAAVEKHKAKWEDPKFIPHPSTWLNGERWEDQDDTQVNQDWMWK